MINDKQIELSRMLFDKLKDKFSEIELIDVTESPENPNTLWVIIAMPDDDDREIALREMASEISADILLDYGYYMLVIIRSPVIVEKNPA